MNQRVSLLYDQDSFRARMDYEGVSSMNRIIFHGRMQQWLHGVTLVTQVSGAGGVDPLEDFLTRGRLWKKDVAIAKLS